MANEQDKLTKTPEMPSIMKPRLGGGISAARKAAVERLKQVKPEDCPHRLGLEFDDSGSMAGEAIKNAITAVQNFIGSCNPLETSITIHPMNESAQALSNDYSVLNMFVATMRATESTPLYGVLGNMLNSDITRAIVFSDGEPNYNERAAYSNHSYNDAYGEENGNKNPGKSIRETTVDKAKSKKIPVDTVFIGHATSAGYTEMKWLAEQTGGIFVHFTDSASLSKSLKYLSPGLRGLLSNPEIKARIEKGEVI